MSDIKNIIKERLSKSPESIEDILNEIAKEAEEVMNEIKDEKQIEEKIKSNYEIASEALLENAKLKAKEDSYEIIEELLSPDGIELFISLLVELSAELKDIKISDPFGTLITAISNDNHKCNCKKKTDSKNKIVVNPDKIIDDYLRKIFD